MYTEHPDKEVKAALVRLSDALCQWERGTGRKSVLILREKDYVYRAEDGKPVPDFVTDEQLLSSVSGTIKKPRSLFNLVKPKPASTEPNFELEDIVSEAEERSESE